VACDLELNAVAQRAIHGEYVEQKLFKTIVPSITQFKYLLYKTI